MRASRVLHAVMCLAAAWCLFAAAPVHAGEPAVKAPPATIVFIDRASVLQRSAVGRSMQQQVEALAKNMEEEFAPENRKLQADVETLQRDAAVMDPSARQAKVAELESRRQAFQKHVQDRQAAIQAGLAKARQQVEAALGPILEALMVEYGANLLLDRGLVVLGTTELDVTSKTIERLDAKLAKVDVVLVTTP